MRFYTADHHFGHVNIIDYAHRPFSDVHEMNESLVLAWNNAVGVDDEVWVLGDITMGQRSESLAVVPRLNGTKILVPGNHDTCWQGYKRGSRTRAAYLSAGFDQIIDNPKPIVIAGKSVVLSHFPYRNPSSFDDRYIDWRPTDRGAWLLHGHVHQLWLQDGRQINVGVDAFAGRPVSEELIAEIITDRWAGAVEPMPWL